jgi:hypothetical protein
MDEVPKEESPTLICLLPATEEGTIIVGASLDYAAEEAKAPAHWSALALLPLLAKSLISVLHRCTLKLVAFPGREHGMRGATWYVSQLTEAQRKTMRAMVDLDNLGRTPAVYALAQSDNTLGIRFIHLKPLSPLSTICDSIRNNLTVCGPVGCRVRRFVY